MHVRVSAVVSLLLLALPACSSEESPSGSSDPTVLPGTSDDFVGARQDVTDVGCERDGDGWRATGTVTNPAASPTDYRVYVSFVDADGATLQLEQVDVRAVPPGQAVEWEGAADVAGDGLQCVLRVERLTKD